MCWSCFKLYADEPVINENVIAAYKQIKGKDADASRLVHHIVADMNLDDSDFDLVANSYLRERYAEAETWERDIFDALKALSEPERATAVAMDWGYIKPDGTLREDLRGSQ
jgi:hypothetical protein